MDTQTRIDDDPYAWLEDVDGERALEWVRARNAEAMDRLGGAPGFDAIRREVLEVLDSDAKIPLVSRAGDRLYNFWRDGDHERGLWRRTTLEQYRTDDPEWETLLDLDALSAAEGESWVWHGAQVLRPDCRRALVSLSRGGSDADVTRELDLDTLTWVEDGFVRPEAKGGLGWVDADTVFAYTDLGPGTMTSSGYPRTVRRWTRGTPLADAPLVFEGEPDDLYISAHHDRTPGFERDLVVRAIAFYRQQVFLLAGDGALTLLDVPESAEVSVHREWLLVELREEWQAGGAVHPAGALLAAPLDDYLAGSRALEVLFRPTPSTSLAGLTWTRSHLVLTVLDDVRHEVRVLTPGADGTDGWATSDLPGAPELTTVSVAGVDPDESEDLWMTTSGYLTPTTLSLVTVGTPNAAPEPLKAMPAFFDASRHTVEQHMATSDDGTRVPYFLVRPTDLALDGTAPTLLYGYGGFEISLTPSYSGGLGRGWVARGGVYVVANIRGGGEYGPRWHQLALTENRHRAYEDFAAVARDLVARGVTRPERLGVQGGSNGGLLTGNMLVGYPDLIGAAVIQVPLLDMRRYSHLLAGASWMAEYGDPDDPTQWRFIRTFSPYHLVDAERPYPPALLTTSTRDDRVHPGHARKMTALLRELGKDVTYYENVEGGHGGAATNAQAAHMTALAYTFLWQRLAGDVPTSAESGAGAGVEGDGTAA
ncbi:prolyl oligopeptidase family serine peptidase [Cellulomonas aerilata]|uniref:prolyl oligopeptidase family serine peptidase n=1 Tax=Cellulomonas aerilata TaxID=515326 RepID=UPI001FEAA9E2|nr:prolyl oligopeptidase family serine peptidase [Cellulomonas aerilata]